MISAISGKVHINIVAQTGKSLITGFVVGGELTEIEKTVSEMEKSLCDMRKEE